MHLAGRQAGAWWLGCLKGTPDRVLCGAEGNPTTRSGPS
jgi:hypothetical protein